MRIRILLLTLILIVFGHTMHAGQIPPSGEGRKVYILLQDGTMELPFTGFHAVCAGYGEGGVKYSTPAGPKSIPWKDVEYILPQWEEGRLVNGTGLYTEVLRPALCPGAYISQVKQGVVKVKKREKVQEETVKFPLSSIHVIAFDKAGLENGRQKLAQKPVLLDPETGIEFVLVKGGCFDMGDTAGDDADGLKQVHTVCQDDFYLGKYEVTQAQWRAVMGKNPSALGACGDNCPVENVSWHDVQDFIRTLKQHAGKAYRLPTEAEWEYAARAGGTKQKYAGTNSDEEIGKYAWYGENSGGRSHPVGQKNPNGLGLYDMSGNVSEWLSDRYDADYYRVSPRNNPPGPSEGDHRVNRGGGWSSLPKKVRADFRDHDNPTRKGNNLGFRLALPAK
jgi:formylglycine-generating enzyme required for sulfatase activity